MEDLLIINAKIWTLDKLGTINKGWITAKDGIITNVGSGNAPIEIMGEVIVDAHNKNLLPGLVDCHTHLMEYATIAVHNTQGSTHKMAAISNLLTAMKCGIVATGEHHLGHPILSLSMDSYKKLIDFTPMSSSIAYGCCWLGLNPKILTSCTRPGESFTFDCLTDDEYRQMALASDFAGENIFLNYTSANVPIEKTPHAGEITYSRDKLKRIIDIFHKENKSILFYWSKRIP